MSMALQEILALGIVAAAVAWMLWRRHRQRGHPGGACQGCAAGKHDSSKEKTVRFYRRQP